MSRKVLVTGGTSGIGQGIARACAAAGDEVHATGPILARTPLARWGTPADVAGPVLFLASPAAASPDPRPVFVR